MVWQLLVADDGQDLIEYALLASFIALAGVAGVSALKGVMGTAYSSYDAAVQSDALVEVPDPQ